jgi:hypothetical protein
MQPHPDSVHFVELAAPDAREVLTSLARRIAAEGTVTELLHSADRADLWLLLVRGEAPPTADLPGAARTWHFTASGGAP